MNTLQLCVLVLHVFSQFSSGGARIIPNDNDLTVFPDACELFQHETTSSPTNSGNCGVQRLDGYNHPWILRSEDGVYHDIHAIVSSSGYENGWRIVAEMICDLRSISLLILTDIPTGTGRYSHRFTRSGNY